MVRITIDDADIKRLTQSFKLSSKQIKKFNQILNRELPKKLLKILRKHTPKDTGETSRSWKFNKQPDGFTITNDRGGIIQFLIDGVEPHVIKPKDKSVLLLKLPGSQIFAKVVNHPGYSKQMNVRTIFTEIERSIEDTVNMIITDILKKSF
jgi:hypothetical protein